MEAEERLIEFWLNDTKVCILACVEHMLEVRLYERGKLMGLHPCQSLQEALEISRTWRAHPPLWPPYN
jgi:hypothetical protein